MKGLVKLLLVVVIALGIHSCLKTPATAGDALGSSGKPTEPSSAPLTVLKVTDLDGNPKEISLTADMSVLYMATWCPHSAAFKKMLNDPVVRSAMVGHKVIAVFGTGEWKTVRSELKDAVKQGEYTQEEYDVILKNIASTEKKSIFFDPSFFDDLTIPTYIGPIPQKADGYPSAQVGDSFFSGAEWLHSELNIPVADVLKIYASYDPSHHGPGGTSNPSASE